MAERVAAGEPWEEVLHDYGYQVMPSKVETYDDPNYGLAPRAGFRIEAYRGQGAHPWRWRLRSRNGRIIANGAEGYATHRNLRRAVMRIRMLLELHTEIPIRWFPPDAKREGPRGGIEIIDGAGASDA